MEVENKIYYYDSIDGKRSRLLDSFNSVENANRETGYSKDKIRKSIRENKPVSLKIQLRDNNGEIVGLEKRFKYFFSGIKFEKDGKIGRAHV